MRYELAAIVALADRLLASNTPATLATLFSARGSTYRTLGSMMVGLPGRSAGAVSGGCLEDYVARAAERATRQTPAAMLHFSTHPEADTDAPVPGCGGAIGVLAERLTPDHLVVLEQLTAAYERDDCSVLACRVERNGECLTVTREWIAGHQLHLAATSDIVRVSRTAFHTRESLHASLGDGAELLAHYVAPLTRLIVFGAGDDARPLCDIGRSLGWHVSVVDRRRRLAIDARFPGVDTVIAADWDEAIEMLRFTPRTAVVLMTHDLEDDARVLSLLAQQPLAYLGVLGPAARRQWLVADHAERHVLTARHTAGTLRGPVGLDLGDRSPAGIAVSIVAEVLAALNARPALPLHRDECLVRV